MSGFQGLTIKKILNTYVHFCWLNCWIELALIDIANQFSTINESSSGTINLSTLEIISF